MPLEGDPARFLAADQHIFIQHIIGDVVEAHRGFVQGQAVAFGQPVDHARGRNRAHHRAASAALFDQVFQGQGHDFVRVDEIAALVHGANAVGVAIRHHPKAAQAGANRPGSAPR